MEGIGTGCISSTDMVGTQDTGLVTAMRAERWIGIPVAPVEMHQIAPMCGPSRRTFSIPGSHLRSGRFLPSDGRIKTPGTRENIIRRQCLSRALTSYSSGRTHDDDGDKVYG